MKFCCNLKYLEKNATGRMDALGWSIQQMGLHHSYSTDESSERVLLINPSAVAQSQIMEKIEEEDLPRHWTSLPLLICGTLATHWPAYASSLYAAVAEIVCIDRARRY